MIRLLKKRALKLFHPILRRLAKLYLSKQRTFNYQGITLEVLPGVFHPGLFFSTKVFLAYLQTIELNNKSVLELGAGSGLISIYCSKHGAHVTSSDINKLAIKGLEENSKRNKSSIRVVLSDLFDDLNPDDFNLILINPPFYPKAPVDVNERAWFCGADFEYFKKLFNQLSVIKRDTCDILMVLSEDCRLDEIMSIAKLNGLGYKKIFTKVVSSEENCIYRIEKL